MLGHFAGWVFANIFIPYLAPIGMVKAIQFLQVHPADHERLRVTYLLREGQYAMGSVAIATSAMFEIFSSGEMLASGAGVTLLILLVVMTVLNTLIFALGVSFGGPPVSEAVRAGITVAAWMRTYRLGAGSLWLALGVSICAFSTHCIKYGYDQESAMKCKSAHNACTPAYQGGVPSSNPERGNR